MRICVDASPAVHHHGGIGRYAHELVRALCEMGQEVIPFYNLPSRADLDCPFDRLPALTSRHTTRRLRFNALLAHALRRAQDRLFPGTDVFHATDHLLPLFAQVPSVFTLHDLTFRLYPQTHTALNRMFLTFGVKRFLDRATAIVAVSQSTKRDAVKICHADATRITVIHHGVRSVFCPASKRERDEVRQRFGLPSNYVLSVATLEPRKNFGKLIDAYLQLREKSLEMPLVLTGARGWLCQDLIKKIEALGLKANVFTTGYVTDGELRALYSAADVFVFPSIYEGFGLPVLEAMACGAPVVCSNTSSLPEVAGDAALYFNPQDPDAIGSAIEQVIADPRLKEKLREAGFSRARGFSWQKTAQQTQAVYQRIAG